MFLDNSYFQGELQLPNLKFNDQATGVAVMLQVTGENTLEWYVEKYEREFLYRLLGVSLCEAFITGVQQEQPNEIWVKLKNKIYLTEGNFSFSPAANYVYYWLSRRGKTQTSMTGEVREEADYSTVAPVAPVLVKVWNDMLPMIAGIRRYLDGNWDTYGQYADDYYCECDFKPINSFNI